MLVKLRGVQKAAPRSDSQWKYNLSLNSSSRALEIGQLLHGGNCIRIDGIKNETRNKRSGGAIIIVRFGNKCGSVYLMWGTVEVGPNDLRSSDGDFMF